MNSTPLSPELLELESRLRAHAASESSADLRTAVIGAVRTELALQGQAATPQSSSAWPWAAIAAVALLAMNLSMIYASQDVFSRRPVSSPSQLSAELQALRLVESLPEGQFK